MNIPLGRAARRPGRRAAADIPAISVLRRAENSRNHDHLDQWSAPSQPSIVGMIQSPMRRPCCAIRCARPRFPPSIIICCGYHEIGAPSDRTNGKHWSRPCCGFRWLSALLYKRATTSKSSSHHHYDRCWRPWVIINRRRLPASGGEIDSSFDVGRGDNSFETRRAFGSRPSNDHSTVHYSHKVC